MSDEISQTVDTLCKIQKIHDERIMELGKRMVDNETLAETDLSYTKDCLRNLDKAFAELQTKHDLFLDRYDRTIMFLCGAFSAMHYDETSNALRHLQGIEKKEE